MLRHQAVNAAKNGDWHQAVALNSQIIAESPSDTHAHNRLGVAYLQLRQLDAAKSSFKQVLQIDKTNAIAKRHLERIKDNFVSVAPAFSNQSFIEEPGKTRAVELHRLAGRQVLNQLSVGQECQLIIKKRYISIEMNDVYIGALPEDLSFRLSKLIEKGNEYTCVIRSCSGNHCCVYLKETVRSAANTDVHSFPPSKMSMNPINDIDDNFALQDALGSQLAELDPDSDDDADKPLEENERSRDRDRDMDD